MTPSGGLSTSYTSNINEKRTVVERIVNLKTRDIVPLIAYSTILFTLIANLIVYRVNKNHG